MVSATKTHTSAPMMDINTTPLIDVMLVLLIMLIITIPVSTHQTAIDLPGATALVAGPIFPDRNEVTLTANDQILWNGTPQTEQQVMALLKATKAMPVEPELRFKPDSYASYATANRLMRDINAAKVSKFGFVGNEAFAQFDKQR